MAKLEENLTFCVQSADWRRIPKLRVRLEEAMAETLAHLPKKFAFPVAVNLLLADDKTIRRLNRDFRGKDKPTNVLSFPQFESRELTKIGKGRDRVELGDVAIAYQYMVYEAKENNNILINHVIHLFIHGLLHLFGYDHLTDKDAVRMERLEKKIMAQLHLPDPYAVTGRDQAGHSPVKGSSKRPVRPGRVAKTRR